MRLRKHLSSANMLRRIHVVLCSQAIFRSPGECGWLHKARRILWAHNKMVALGYIYTLGKQTFHSPKRCTSRNATSADFLKVQIYPRVV